MYKNILVTLGRGRSTPDPGGAREQAIRQSKGMVLGHLQPDLENRDSTRTILSRPIYITHKISSYGICSTWS